jgi:hypothetical protein
MFKREMLGELFLTLREPDRPIPRTRRRIDNFYWTLLPEARQLDMLSKATVKSLLLPGGLLLAAVAMLQTGLLTLTVPGLMFVLYGAVTAGLLLAWRFHSSRVFFALLLLLLAQEATSVFSAGRLPLTGSGRTALEAVALLVPLNFAAARTRVCLSQHWTVVSSFICAGDRCVRDQPCPAAHGLAARSRAASRGGSVTSASAKLHSVDLRRGRSHPAGAVPAPA